MFRTFFCCIFLFFAFAAFAQRPSYGGKLKPEQANMDVKHYTIDLALDIPNRNVTGYAIIRADLKQPATALLFDLMDSFRVSKVLVNGKPATFGH